MGKMPDGNLHLLFHGRQKRPLIVDLESENAVLVGEAEGRWESSAIGGVRDGMEGEALEWGQHGEFELEGVGRGKLERPPGVVRVFREGDGEGLGFVSLTGWGLTWGISMKRTTSFLIR
jgi:hypothetical protein